MPIEIRDFHEAKDLLSLPRPVIVNCTGLGAKALFNDEGMIPIKGQLTILLPEEVIYATMPPISIYFRGETGSFSAGITNVTYGIHRSIPTSRRGY